MHEQVHLYSIQYYLKPSAAVHVDQQYFLAGVQMIFLLVQDIHSENMDFLCWYYSG